MTFFGGVPKSAHFRGLRADTPKLRISAHGLHSDTGEPVRCVATSGMTASFSVTHCDPDEQDLNCGVRIIE